MDIPYYRLSGTAELVQAAGLLVAIMVRAEFSRVQLHQWKWIWLRGFFGCGTMLLGWTSVAVGCPLGDASALGSVNVVVAALLGRAFLGEPLRILHILALVSSVAGAIVISRPTSAAMTQEVDASRLWLGYALALSAGISSGGLFIASRRSQGISPLVMSFSVSLHEGVSLWVIAATGLMEDGPLGALIENPFLGAGWLAIFVVLFLFATVTMSVGAQLCPAAASSTIYTSVSMCLGYTAQTLIHRQQPEPMKVAGAGLMLLAVAFMASARRCHSQEASARELETPLMLEHTTRTDETLGSTAGAPEQTESLASFIASEFSGVSFSQRHSMRQRRTLVAAVKGVASTSA